MIDRAKRITNIFLILEWIFFITLFVLALLSTSQVWNAYQKGECSFKQSEIFVTELPTATVCFWPPKSVRFFYIFYAQHNSYKTIPISSLNIPQMLSFILGLDMKE